MYICAEKVSNTKRLVKCQSYKFGVIGLTRNYLIVLPDISENPFLKATLIDCGKLFVTKARIPLSSLHAKRPDVSEKLHAEIKHRLKADPPLRIDFNPAERE
jgi:hypothetical protein